MPMIPERRAGVLKVNIARRKLPYFSSHFLFFREILSSNQTNNNSFTRWWCPQICEIRVRIVGSRTFFENASTEIGIDGENEISDC